MFERILERLSVSKYKNNFILKGGLLLSSIMGTDTRTTMDMDTCVKGIDLTDAELYEILNEIETTLSIISESSFTKDLWKNYAKKHKYTENIKFEEIIDTIYKIKDIK